MLESYCRLRQHKQAERQGKLWKEPPVDWRTFQTEFMRRKSYSPMQLDLLAHFFGDDPQTWNLDYKVFCLCWGMGSGKNFITEGLVAYTFYLMLCMVSPHHFFWGTGADTSQTLDILNFSFIREEQAKRVFFERLKAVVREVRNPETGGRWFEEHGVDLRDRGIGDVQEKIIKLPHAIQARCMPFTRAAWEGSNIILAIFDEPSRAAGSPADNAKAHDLFRRVVANTTTRFGTQSKVVLFSYPESADDDLILETLADCRTVRKPGGIETNPDGNANWYGSFGATYEVAEGRRSREDFADFERSDPELFQQVIECHPPKSVTTFYREFPEKIAQSLNDQLRPVVVYETYPLTRIVQQEGREVRRTFTAVRLLHVRGDNEIRVLGGDPGKNRDCFGLALARFSSLSKSVKVTVRQMTRRDVVNPLTDRPVGQIQEERDVEAVQPTIDRRVIVDGLIRIEPLRYRDGKVWKRHPIDYVSVKDALLELKKHFPGLQAAGFDNWQSASMIGELLVAGINAEDLPFTTAQQFNLYHQHKSLLYNDLWECLPDEQLRTELEDLQILNNRKIDHKTDGSKDLADAVVIATHLALGQAVQPKAIVAVG